MSDVTRILHAIERGEPHAAEALLPLVYEELRKLAAARMARENPDNTLQPTALVHEAWLRLAANEAIEWSGRAHFFGAAAEAMRRILIDRARRKSALRHGGGHLRVELENADIASPVLDEKILAINEALERLASHDQTKAELVKLRYFAGLTLEEAARVLDISESTARRHWVFARAWLHKEISK